MLGRHTPKSQGVTGHTIQRAPNVKCDHNIHATLHGPFHRSPLYSQEWIKR